MWAFCRRYGCISCDGKWQLVVENGDTDATAKHMCFILEGPPNTTKDECDEFAKHINEWLDGDSPWCLKTWYDEDANKGTFKDSRDGNTYKTVKIGKQVWLAENLNWEGAGVCYNDDPAMGAKYGRLYNWDEAMKAVPPGWHLPTREEWHELIDFTGNGNRDASKVLKAAKEGNSNDEYGFSAMLGGFCIGPSVCVIGSGPFFDIGECGSWWSSTENLNKKRECTSTAYGFTMRRDEDSIFTSRRSKDVRLSVRLIQD